MKTAPATLLKIISMIACFIFMLIFTHSVAVKKYESIYDSLDNVINYPRYGSQFVVLTASLFAIVFIILFQSWVFGRLKKVGKIVSIVLLVILFFLVNEWGLRIFVINNPTLFRPHPYLIYEPNILNFPEHFQMNSKGFREGEFSDKKDPDEIRYILVGDSSSFGHGVSEQERFSYILEKKLCEHYGQKIRILNCAYPGYSSFMARNLYDKKLKNYNADGIIISFNNDINAEFMEDKKRVCPPGLMPVMDILYKSEFYLFLRKNVFNLKFGKSDKREKEGVRLPRVSMEDVSSNYAYLATRAKKSIIISMPLKYCAFGNCNELHEYKERIKQAAGDTNSVFVDCFYTFRDLSDNDAYFIDDVHPNTAGHKLIAEMVLREIIKKKIFEK